MSKSRSLLLYFFIGLVIVGLATQLIKSPGQFVTSMLILFGITFVMFIVLRAVLKNRQGPTDPDAKKFKEAVKQSQKKYGKPVTPKDIKKNKEKNIKPKRKKYKRRKSHLKVIKGHKKENDYEEKKKDSNK